MPTGIYIRTKKRKWRLANIRKGHPILEETKKKIGLALKGKNKPPRTEEHIRKISEANKGNKNSLGYKHIEEARRKMSIAHQGEKSYLWQGGITKEKDKIRKGMGIIFWRKAILRRDNFTCQKYRIKCEKLIAHHIQNFAQYPELRVLIDNGITLSEKAHNEFHKIYGKQNNTREQLKEFLNLQALKLN